MKHLGKKLLVVGGILVLFGTIHHVAQADNDDERSEAIEQHRILVGYNINPVRLNLTHKNPDLVGLGSYLVNAVGGCNDCHTNPATCPEATPFWGSRRRSTRSTI